MESEASNDKNYKVTINLKNYLSGKYAYFFVTILFIALSLLYIKLFGVNLIIADEFYFVDYVIGEKKIVSDIFVKHTEHFNFVPISLYTILAKATHLNSKIIMAFSMILLDIIYFLYLLCIYKREKGKVTIFLPLIIGLILFSPRKSEIFLSSMGITYIIAVVFTLINFFIFQEYRVKKEKKVLVNLIYISLLAIGSIISFMSSGQGIICSFSICVIWLFHERKKCLIDPWFYTWTIFTIVCLMFYMSDTSINQSYSLTDNLIDKPLEILHYTLRFIGNIASNSFLGFCIVILSLLIFVDFLNNNRSQDILPVLIILNYILIAISTAAVRIELGPGRGSASRYVVFGVMVLLGCVLYLYKKETLNIIIVNINLKSKLFISLYSIVLLIVTAYFFIGIHGSIKDSKNKNLLRYCFQTYERQPDSILGLFHFNNLEYFYEIANKLEANKLNIFYDNPYDKEENNIQIKKLENPNEYLEFTKFDMVGIDNKEYISINGIIYKNNNIRNYDKVIGVFENNKYICYSNISNPFIKTLPKRKRDKRGGFLCNIPFKTLKKGKYAFKIQFVNKENTIAYEINPNITLIIDNNILIIKSISPL